FYPILRPPPSSTLFPYTTLFRSDRGQRCDDRPDHLAAKHVERWELRELLDVRARDHAALHDAAADREDLRVAGGVVKRLRDGDRSEEHTSELQSRGHLVCRLLLE